MNAPLNLIVLGHVDHGKSTLIGRLLYETGSLPETKIKEIEASAKKRGQEMEWGFLLDSLQIERDQGITVDTTRIWLRLKDRDICIIDAPGHHEFLRNMLTGATSADAALLLVDAAEGMAQQTKRHAYLLHLLGIKQVVVIFNKMDKLQFDQQAYAALHQSLSQYLSQLDITPVAIIPASAKRGDNIVSVSDATPWYKGPALLEALKSFAVNEADARAPLRILVQDVYKQGDKRIIAGSVESGTVRTGERVLFSPSNSSAVVQTIETWPPSEAKQVQAGQPAGFTLDEQIFVERGQVVSHEEQSPLLLSHLEATLFWLASKPLQLQSPLTMKLGTASYRVEVTDISYVTDTENLQQLKADTVQQHQIATVKLRAQGLVVADTIPSLSRFALLKNNETVAAGWLDLNGAVSERIAGQEVKSRNLSPFKQPVTALQRAERNGHRGLVIWFSGLSGSGKSTLAIELEKRLFARGMQVFVLDGDNLRTGLNRDLGFSMQDRHENIRRAAEVAALMAQAGMIVITSFITPTEQDRAVARAACPERFHNIYIKADLATCEERDVKGLYKKAREGKIAQFTGISAPFEAPEQADLVVDTTASIETCVMQLMEYILRYSNETASGH